MHGPWSQGYYTEAPYTRGYYAEQAPISMAWASLMCGVVAPPLDKPFTYVDLGCGYGQTAAVTAAIYPQARVLAVDFNPDHTVYVRRHAEACGLDNLEVHDRSFAEMLDVDFQADYVGIHGVISWVADDVVQDIVRLLDRRMRDGGVAYIAYNAMPGRGSTVPLQRLLMQRAAQETGSASQRLSKAMDFCAKLKDTAWYFRHHPSVVAHLDGAIGRDPSYLVHEYMNAHWNPLFFAELHEILQGARMTFVGSADAQRNVSSLEVGASHRPMLDEISELVHRETVKDYILDTRFRRDLFGRGRDRLSMTTQAQRILDTPFLLAKNRDECKLEVNVPAGEVRLRADHYVPLLDAFAEGIHRGRDLLGSVYQDDERLHVCLLVLSAVGYIMPVLEEAGLDERRARTDAFNDYWLDRVEEDSIVLASPVTGQAIRLRRMEALLTRGVRAGVEDLAPWALDTLDAAGHRLVLAGERVATREAAVAEVRDLERRYRTYRLPQLKRYGIV